MSRAKQLPIQLERTSRHLTRYRAESYCNPITTCLKYYNYKRPRARYCRNGRETGYQNSYHLTMTNMDHTIIVLEIKK